MKGMIFAMSDTTVKLKISFFGGFCMESPSFRFAPSSTSNSSMILLLSCLMVSGERGIPKDQLIDILWPNASDKDMAGALRTLVYRTRKELEKFFPGENFEYIKFSGDSYFWSPEIPVLLDIEEFERINTLFKTEKNPEKKYILAEQLFNVYTGEFLPNYNYVEFLLYRNVYFHNQYAACYSLSL